MKKTLFTLLLVFLGTGMTVHAQNAREWLDLVEKTYDNSATYYIKFELENAGDDKPMTGELFASKDKYSVQIGEIKQIYDGKKLYTISTDDKEITVSKPDANSDDFLSPTKVLKMYKTGFDATLGKVETVEGKKIQFIKLLPKEKSEVTEAEVGIDTSNNSLKLYSEKDGAGNKRTITVKQYLEDLIVPGAIFKFDQSKYEKDGYVVTML